MLLNMIVITILNLYILKSTLDTIHIKHKYSFICLLYLNKESRKKGMGGGIFLQLPKSTFLTITCVLGENCFVALLEKEQHHLPAPSMRLRCLFHWDQHSSLRSVRNKTWVLHLFSSTNMQAAF